MIGASDECGRIGVVYDEMATGFFVVEKVGRDGVGPLTQLVDIGRVVTFCTGFFVFDVANLVGFFVAVVVELIRFGLELDDVGRFGIAVL